MQHSSFQFDDFTDQIISAETILKSILGNLPDKHSTFFKSTTSILDILAEYKKEAVFTKHEDVREKFRKSIGFIDIIRKINIVHEHSDFYKLEKHLELLFTDSTYVQNFKSKSIDSTSNKVFELYAALSALQFVDGIEMDDPVTSSNGENPDIIVKYKGMRIGIACKCLHSQSFETYRDNFYKGQEQIDRSNVDWGFVFINLKNIIDNDLVWQIIDKDENGINYLIYENLNIPVMHNQVTLDRYYYNLGQYLGDFEYLTVKFENSKTFPISVNFIPLTFLSLNKGNEVVTYIRRLGLIPFLEVGDIKNIFYDFIEKFDKSISDITK